MATPNSRSVWLQARALGDNPKGEWTYSVLLWRAIASQPDGLEWSYEYLSTWGQLVKLVRFVDAFAERGFEPDHVYRVTLGLKLFDEAYYAPQGRLPLPAPGEPFRGRHSVQLAGMENDDTLVFANSWGEGRWGDAGYGYISRAYFEEYVDLVLVSRPAFFGPSLALDAELKRRSWAAGRPGTVLIDDVVAAWYTFNYPRAKAILLRGESLHLARRTLFTVDGLPFEVVELRLGEVLVGRMHIKHQGQDSLVDELWVPPAVRRRGYGSQLLEVADELAAQAGAQAVTLHLHEADGHQAGGARAFAEASGYAYAVAASKGPNVVATATRSVSREV